MFHDSRAHHVIPACVGVTNMKKIMKKRKSGFTLIELLVVIAIIGLLVSLLLPAIQSAREMARRSQCSNNMRQMALAMNIYHESLKSLPPGNLILDSLKENACHVAGTVYCGSMGWAAFILPYLEQVPLYDKIDFDTYAYTPEADDCSGHEGAVGDERNKEVGENVPAVFTCPSATRQSKYHKDYGVNGDRHYPESTNEGNGLFLSNSGIRFADVTDGLSNTFMLMEASHHRWWLREGSTTPEETRFGANPFIWVNGGGQGYVISEYGMATRCVQAKVNSKEVEVPTRGARSDHAGRGVISAMGDASIHFISEKIDFGVYQGLFTRSGGEDVKIP